MATVTLAYLSSSFLGGKNDDGGRPRQESFERFDRTANSKTSVDEDIVVTIHGNQYNVSSWAAAHPGGHSVLMRFHQKDATNAFEAVGHSDMAKAMLRMFITNDKTPDIASATPKNESPSKIHSTTLSASSQKSIVSKWRIKLFTIEDPYGIHKCMGLFSLLHFAYRYGQMLISDPSAGFGTRKGSGPSIFEILFIIPHAILSLSSLIFHTVPMERVVGKPMIWQEFRAHSIIFALRSVLTTFFAWMAIYNENEPAWRRAMVLLSCLTVLAANVAADWATETLLQNKIDSTTATMPYWPGCSVKIQRRFKSFYAYCQFLATLACLVTSNPAWPFCVLLPIQIAPFLMTLVRKGLISARSYHTAYTISLCMPFMVGTRHLLFMKTPDFVGLLTVGWIVYQLRRQGISKYLLWALVIAVRVSCGNRFINWQIW